MADIQATSSGIIVDALVEPDSIVCFMAVDAKQVRQQLKSH